MVIGKGMEKNRKRVALKEVPMNLLYKPKSSVVIGKLHYT